MSLDYECIYKWSKVHDLIVNRVGIVNELHGCRYHSGLTNPCRLLRRNGFYVVVYCHDEIARWRLYDLESVNLAFAAVDALAKACWAGRREGVLSFSVAT